MSGQFDVKELINLTKMLIAVPSITGTDDVKKVFASTLDWLHQEKINAEMAYLHGVPNLVARVGNPSGPKLLWVSHLDIVPAGNFFNWKHNPFYGYEEGEYLYGRGASDAKSSAAAILMALKALKQEEQDLPGEVTLMLSGAAESGSKNGIRGMLERSCGNFNAAVVAEATDLCIEIAQRGLRWIEVKIQGIASHAGRPSLGLNAISEAGKILNAFNEHTFYKRNDIFEAGAQVPSISVNKIHGGIQNNLVAEDCRMIIDRRMMPGETEKSVMAELKDIVDSVIDPRTRVEYQVLGKGWEPFILDQDEQIVKVLCKAYREIVKEDPVIRGKGTCTDASHIYEMGIPVVIFGPGIPFDSHISNEKVKIEKIVQMVEILIRSAEEFFGQTRSTKIS